MRFSLHPAGSLEDYAQVRGYFEASQIYDAAALVKDGLFVEQSLPTPLRKDYDAIEGPREWLQFDLSQWVAISAVHDSRRVGSALIAFDTPGIDMLEGRDDLAVIWDLRVESESRRMGVGTGLFKAAERWAREKGCRELKVETQNVNVAACRLYQRNGCFLAQVNAGVYVEFPSEVQLIWRKEIAANESRRDDLSISAFHIRRAIDNP